MGRSTTFPFPRTNAPWRKPGVERGRPRLGGGGRDSRAALRLAHAPPPARRGRTRCGWTTRRSCSSPWPRRRRCAPSWRPGGPRTAAIASAGAPAVARQRRTAGRFKHRIARPGKGAGCQPLAAADPALQRLHSEAQMLLYSHPFNDAREARGLPPVNGFWPHGAGALAQGATPIPTPILLVDGSSCRLAPRLGRLAAGLAAGRCWADCPAAGP